MLHNSMLHNYMLHNSMLHNYMLHNSMLHTDLLQGEDQLVQPSSLRQCDLGRGHLVQQRQHGDLVRSHPVLDAEHVSVHHSVRHHGVEIQAFVHTRHLRGVQSQTRSSLRMKPVDM